EGRGEQVWERLDTRPGDNGWFTLVFSESKQPWRFRIEADGFQPFVSNELSPGLSGVYEVALKRANPAQAIRGVVLLPNGAPAAGVSVALLTLDYNVMLRKAKFDANGIDILTNTDVSGNFAFQPNPRAHSVAAVAEAGFVKLRVKSAAEPVTLRLQPWGRVE